MRLLYFVLASTALLCCRIKASEDSQSCPWCESANIEREIRFRALKWLMSLRPATPVSNAVTRFGWSGAPPTRAVENFATAWQQLYPQCLKVGTGLCSEMDLLLLYIHLQSFNGRYVKMAVNPPPVTFNFLNTSIKIFTGFHPDDLPLVLLTQNIYFFGRNSRLQTSLFTPPRTFTDGKRNVIMKKKPKKTLVYYGSVGLFGLHIPSGKPETFTAYQSCCWL